MNLMALLIGASVLALFIVILWMAALSAKKKRQIAEEEARKAAYRKAIEKNHERDIAERIHKAETGHVATQLFLGKEAEVRNPKEALYWYEMAAKADNEIGIQSLIRLCDKYSQENIVLRVKGEYWKHVHKMRAGNKNSQYEVGVCLIKGKGIDPDIPRGVALIEQVAQADILKAQHYLGEWFLSENSPMPDPAKAAHWNLAAAKHGSVEAMIRAGRQYTHGTGVPQSNARAVYWLETAAETGNGRAQYLAGEFWENTTGEEFAVPLAYIWYFLSAQSGFEAAKKRRDVLAGQLEISAIVALQNIAKPIFE